MWLSQPQNSPCARFSKACCGQYGEACNLEVLPLMQLCNAIAKFDDFQIHISVCLLSSENGGSYKYLCAS